MKPPRRPLPVPGAPVKRRKGLVVKKKPAVAGFFYRKAGLQAPRQVQAAIERFRSLPPFIRARLPLWSWLLGGPLSAYKFYPGEVNYRLATGERSCGSCNSAMLHLGTKTPVCMLMRGVIAEDHTCDRWHPVAAVGVYRKLQGG